MIRRIVHYSMFPSRIRKWCTTSLKLKPLKAYFDTLDFDVLNVVGVRKEESKRRSKLKELEWNSMLDAYTWRPIINWKIQDVIDIHKRFNLTPNPLYLESAERVGCFPCIMSRKKEIQALSKQRIDIIREIEDYISKGKEEKRTFFHNEDIDTVFEWSKTSRGGKQFELFNLETPSCFKWGMCGT